MVEVHIMDEHNTKEDHETKYSLCGTHKSPFYRTFFFYAGNFFAQGSDTPYKYMSSIRVGDMCPHSMNQRIVIRRNEDEWCKKCQNIAHERGIGTFTIDSMKEAYGHDYGG